MKRIFSIFAAIAVLSASAAPTANEDFVISEIASATNAVSASVGASLASLSSRVSLASQASTNYTDAAIAAIPAPNLSAYLPKSGGEMSGNLTMRGSEIELAAPAGLIGGESLRLSNEGIKTGDGPFANTYTFPDDSGTLALAADVSAKADKTTLVAATNAVSQSVGSSLASLSSRLSLSAAAATNYTDAAADALFVDIARNAQIIAAVSNEAQLVYRLFSSSNVIDEVTNYNSVVHTPTRRLYMLTNTTRSASAYLKIWDEETRHIETLSSATNYAHDAIRAYAAPRAWASTTSGLGADAPSNTTWISTPTTVFAGGLEYAKFLHTGGEVWVLCGNGMMQFDPTTNAYFRITADDGTDIFSIEKTDAVTVGADAGNIRIDRYQINGETEISIEIFVPVVSAIAPTFQWATNLVAGATVWNDAAAAVDFRPYEQPGWEKSEDYNPEGETGWYFIWQFRDPPPRMFFKFQYTREGSTKIKNSAAMDVTGGILCTDGIHRVRPVYNNGAVTWEVISQ